jgi:uncharacterized membrane protein YkvA (DUF1232 family)
MRRAPRITPANGPRDSEDLRARAGDFSASAFWQKLARFAVTAGRELVEKALWLYYAAERPDVPRWAKLTMWGALAYFVMPVDAIPDLLPGVGYVDDLGALAAALATVAGYVDEDVKARARERLSAWFGPSLN